MQQLSHQNGGIDLLLQGNEAIARGAIEAGVSFCAGYPGNPSSEIIETLVKAAKTLPLYVEWSVNEKVALEAATAASFAGLRAIVTMKQNGVNVASDFLTNLTLSGTKGGLVLVTCDDPSGISSTNEEDARIFAQMADVPLLEPATPKEALEMTKWAFDLSEQIANIVIVRSVSRLSHTRSNVHIGPLPDFQVKAAFDTTSSFHTFPITVKHKLRHEKLAAAAAIFENSGFNHYDGPPEPDLLIITCGCAWNYAREAVKIGGVQDRTGICKVGTTWPLPVAFLKKQMDRCRQLLIIEEVDPFLENNVKILAADWVMADRQQTGKGDIGGRHFLGKASGHIPDYGELNPQIVLSALESIFNLSVIDRDYQQEVLSQTAERLFPREFGFCPGCPHRGSYYAIKKAIAWDGRNGFVSGDIGCYTMGIWPTGFSQVKSVHAMGSGLGLACGYGKLARFGFDQPVITVCGDSTFFHAGLPALVNAKFNKADILLIILDNRATAMTGFQPHPGTDQTAMGEATEPVDIEALCQSLGLHVETADPFETDQAARRIYDLMQAKGPRVLVMNRKCGLLQAKQGGFPYAMQVDPDRCLGEACGCGRYCTRIFRCPGLIWNETSGKAEFDNVVCVGCGICAAVCPNQAIIKSAAKEV